MKLFKSFFGIISSCWTNVPLNMLFDQSSNHVLPFTFYLILFLWIVQCWCSGCHDACSDVHQCLLACVLATHSPHEHSGVQMLQRNCGNCGHRCLLFGQHGLPPPSLHLHPLPGPQAVAACQRTHQPHWLPRLHCSSRRAAECAGLESHQSRSPVCSLRPGLSGH